MATTRPQRGVLTRIGKDAPFWRIGHYPFVDGVPQQNVATGSFGMAGAGGHGARDEAILWEAAVQATETPTDLNGRRGNQPPRSAT